MGKIKFELHNQCYEVEEDAYFFCDLTLALGWVVCNALAIKAGYKDVADLQRTANTMTNNLSSSAHYDRSHWMASELWEVIERLKI